MITLMTTTITTNMTMIMAMAMGTRIPMLTTATTCMTGRREWGALGRYMRRE